MDNKKIVTVAVLAVLALAFAGYGYADYTASTYNEGNSVVINYITVEPDGWDAIAAANDIKIDTYTYNDNGANAVLYKLADDTATATGVEYVDVGTNYTLTITDGTTVECAKYTIEATVLGTVNNDADGFNLYLKIVDGNADPVYEKLDTTTTFDVTSDTVVLNLSIKVNNDKEIDFPTPSGWDKIIGSSEEPADEPLLTGPDADNPTQDNQALATFIFKVTGVVQV